MKRLAAKIAYDGSVFSGFARQRKTGILSVIERIEIALRSMGITEEVLGAGRTDKGVHATAQVISFCVRDDLECQKIQNLLNKKLYPHIFIKSLKEISMDFHPRFCAKKRAYRYIFSDHYCNPFVSSYISCEKYGDTKKIQEALGLFLGRHHFVYFKKQGSFTQTDIRQIFQAFLYKHKIFSQDCLIIYLEADGFLRAQVRLMIGAVLAYSRGEIGLDDIVLQLKGEKRIFSQPVSPNGLYLSRIIY